MFKNKKIDMNVKAKVSSSNRSNLGPLRVAIFLLILGTCEFEHKFIVCKHLLHPVILGLDLSQDFRVEIDWNNHANYIDTKTTCH